VVWLLQIINQWRQLYDLVWRYT